MAFGTGSSLSLAISSITVARLDFRLGWPSAISAQGSTDVITLLELTLGVTTDIALICSGIDELSFAGDTLGWFPFHNSFCGICWSIECNVCGDGH